MSLNADGFYRPEVDEGKCDNCGQCAECCPMCNAQMRATDSWAQPRIYAGWSQDNDIRRKSSSGGVFSVLAKTVLSAGGAVVGCVWGDNWVPVHRLAASPHDVAAMRGSKYVPSYVGTAYRDTLNFVQQTGKPVLFSGTPCQIAAMRNIAPKHLGENITCCEVLCHGVPSLRVFHLYLQFLFGGETIREYTFRSKRVGWISPLAVSESGKVYSVSVAEDLFMQGFCGQHLFLNETCYDCPFQRLPRLADITLGDFWGVSKQLHDPMGISLISVDTAKGEEALNSAAGLGGIELVPSNIQNAVAKNIRLVLGRWRMPRRRGAFLADVQRGMTFRQLVEKHYSKPTARFAERVINKAWRTFHLRMLGY